MVNDPFLDTLKAKEAELQAQLEATSIWKQILGIRTTIELFSGNGNGKSENGTKKPQVDVPAEYSLEGTWGAKILYILKKHGPAFVDEIMTAMKQYEPGVYGNDEILYKRVSQNCSVLKGDGKIDGKQVGIKVKYFIK